MLASEIQFLDSIKEERLMLRFDRYAEADVSQYGKTGTGPYDHFFGDF